jgi:hypothetical protein
VGRGRRRGRIGRDTYPASCSRSRSKMGIFRDARHRDTRHDDPRRGRDLSCPPRPGDAVAARSVWIWS